MGQDLDDGHDGVQIVAIFLPARAC
jgi:hypothetical protein